MRRTLRTLGRGLGGLVLAAVVLAGVLVLRTPWSPPGRSPVEPMPAAPAVDSSVVAAHLAGALRFATVSHEDPKDDDASQLEGLGGYLELTFPKSHATLTRERVGEHALLFTWPGSDGSLAPVLFAAHQDVVPVEPGTESKWAQAPFSGALADGFVWGRGAIDDKGSLICLLEAVEALASEGFRPVRTVYLALGADEEVGGAHGARQIAELLRSRSVKLNAVIDEGGSITHGIIAGVSRPIALVGTGEKGYASVELVVEAPGGHSSMPPPHTAIGILASAIERLERNQMPTRLPDVTRLMLERLAPEMPFGERVVMSNLWLFSPAAAIAMTRAPSSAAAVRTTTAATVVGGGTKQNVLPSTARAVVNFRILPGDTVADVTAHVRGTVADPRVRAQLLDQVSEPPPVSSADSSQFARLQGVIERMFPEARVSPYLVVGMTDSRHYGALTEATFRFSPFRLEKDDLPRIHGTNERVSVDQLPRAVRFYEGLIRELAR